MLKKNRGKFRKKLYTASITRMTGTKIDITVTNELRSLDKDFRRVCFFFSYTQYMCLVVLVVRLWNTIRVHKIPAKGERQGISVHQQVWQACDSTPQQSISIPTPQPKYSLRRGFMQQAVGSCEPLTLNVLVSEVPVDNTWEELLSALIQNQIGFPPT